MKPSSAKAKGKLLENYVADQIREKGIDPRAVRDGASGAGNREKGDIVTSMMILDQNAGIEVKNQKVISIPSWWRQTCKLESLGREPMLVFKENQKPVEDTLCVMYLDTVLELIKRHGKTTEIEVVKEYPRETVWLINTVISALKKLQKALEQ